MISVIKEGIVNNLLFILKFISSLSLKPCLFLDGTETVFSVLGTVLLQAIYLKARGQPKLVSYTTDVSNNDRNLFKMKRFNLNSSILMVMKKVLGHGVVQTQCCVPIRETRLSDWASGTIGRQYGVELLAAVIELTTLIVIN
jgi:hypothetical protein